MGQRTLSIFIDESGDFGKYNPRSPYYYVAMVFHDQSLDISEKVQGLDEHIRHLGFPDHAIHAGPLVRREKQYSQDTMERRQALFKTLFHFLRSLDVRYVCPKVNKMECDDSKEAFIAKLSRVMSDELKKHSDYLCSFDLIINYYDYGQSELTKILISIFSALFSDVEFRKVRPRPAVLSGGGGSRHSYFVPKRPGVLGKKTRCFPQKDPVFTTQNTRSFHQKDRVFFPPCPGVLGFRAGGLPHCPPLAQ